MLSLAELRRATAVVGAELTGARLERVVQPDATRVVLTLYARGGKRHLVLCCQPGASRVGELAAPPSAPGSPPGFCQYLRAHLRGARLAGASLRGGDRQLALRFESPAGAGSHEILLSLLGRRSNVYVLDAELRVRAALRPLARTRDDLATGEPWRDPASPAPPPGEDRFAGVDDSELLRAIERAGARAERDRAGDALARRVRQALRKEGRRLEKKLADVGADLAESEAVRDLERQGELLKSVLREVRSGDTEARARDFETGEEVVIPLDPAASPRQNLEALFKRYHKLVRRLTKAGAQVDGLRAQRLEFEREASALEALLEGGDAARAELEQRAARPPLRRWLDRYAPAEGRPRAPGAPAPARKGPFADLPARLVPRRYRSRDGLEIWVGRSDEGNDHLTTRLARGKDLFFHLDGMPGSHVVLRTEGRPDPPPESLVDAAELAVHFSKAKNASRADVHVAPIKQVRKPRGAKPGLVTVTGGRTLHLRREEARLRRLLDSLIDE